ncbi:hypothetical protein [Herbidospora sp. RD11066]
MAAASFVGLSPWPSDDSPRIELETPTGLIDLHNNANLVSVGISVDPAELVLSFSHAHDWREIDPSKVNVRLVFSGVQALRVAQDADYDPRAGDTLEGIVHRVISGRSEFEIDAGDWFFEFYATQVAIDMER